MEVRPPRQWDDTIPKELERICLKTLSKRASERYTTAKDMADDLRHYLAEASAEEKSSVTGRNKHEAEVATPMPSPVPTPSDHQAIKIVPKGLRSFDANDADFFLELLPGPRDREGLPESLRFWKTRIETTNGDSTFLVALIYGPSGCGKSSLMKAGLLPRLAMSVTAVYIEATADETEARLLKGLRRQLPDLPTNLGLVESLAALRRAQFLEPSQKVLLVLDQFEQWLHARRNEENTELVQALRHCDGGRVQCIVMVRDDFWMAATRFMMNLEISLVQGQNCAAVDLFDLLHAHKVLAAFGRAYGRLPDNLGQCTKDQDAFLDQAVSGLAQDGKVISVRLALFAEMVKGKPWTPATLKEVGGTKGVGVTFLEETFTSSTAPPQHRLHQRAAQAVLKALLPESGTDIKGHMRSQQELLEASDYASRPKDFDGLIRILDQELRLITPTDPDGKEESSTSSLKAGEKYYQLTHDYLVHSLRAWLTRKQKETHRGRAELLLADRAAVWSARPENRQLPSLLQWFNIRWWTQKKNWTLPQKKMMAKAGRYHAVRGMVVGVLLAVATITGLMIRDQVEERRKATHAAGLVAEVLNADTAKVPDIIGKMAEYRKWTDPMLHEEYDKAATKPRQKLHASLALLPVDGTQITYLHNRLLDAEPHEVAVIRDALAPHKDELQEKLWAVVESPERGKESQRLRAAVALAKYDPESEKWAKASGPVVDQLVAENSVFLAFWMEGFRPIKGKLLESLKIIYGNPNGRESERTLATNILADYGADQPQVLADLLMKADEKQFAVIYPKFKEHGEEGLSLLIAEIDKKLPPEQPSSDDDREKLAKRQANAAVALLRMNQPAKVWPLFKHGDDPRVRSYLIHRLGPLGADAQAIIKRLDQEPEISIRRALLLSLGEYGEKDFSVEDRKALLPRLQEIYLAEADPGLHASAEWLLRTWKEEGWLKQENEKWAKDKDWREKKVAGIKELVTKDKDKAPPQLYVNGQGQTMVVVPAWEPFLMGSPATEPGRLDWETQHKKRIGRTFAIGAKSVTMAEYRRFKAGYGIGEIEALARTADSPVIGTNWYQAAAYCNWLSKEEGIDKAQWCYETNFLGEVTKLKEKYLSLSGYRLPTEAEMEYATRAGALTSRYYGETDELLPQYAWYSKNSQEKTWPVGTLKPNDLGLFDVQGNVFTWCQESLKAYPAGKGDEAAEDQEDGLVVVSIRGRVLRGGSYLYQASNVRSAFRLNLVPASRTNINGFRAARTFTP